MPTVIPIYAAARLMRNPLGLGQSVLLPALLTDMAQPTIAAASNSPLLDQLRTPIQPFTKRSPCEAFNQTAHPMLNLPCSLALFQSASVVQSTTVRAIMPIAMISD